MVRPAPAQEIVGRIFQLKVDPRNGDDASAALYNPAATGPNKPLQNHQGAPALVTGELQHAPYSFRTVTAAVSWINSLGNPPLPWTNPDNGQVIRHIVIHCLPGLYGPILPNEPGNDDAFDPNSGEPWNGEQFPIVIPRRVGIQGTSALDTIFDARDHEQAATTHSNIFVFQSPVNLLETEEWNESFIDSVAMRGCRSNGSGSGGAAVLIRDRSYLGRYFRPSISNCFIYGNDVGVLIRNIPTTAAEDRMEPRIVANTIAWNQVGIVSTGLNNDGGVGNARPVILDNLIDPIRPQAAVPGYLTGIGAGTNAAPSCFEGLDWSDLVCSTIPPDPLPPVPCVLSGNFNGYHNGLRNTGSSWPFGVATPRSATPLTAPVVDLASLLGPWPSTSRAILFVADAFRFLLNHVEAHDLRLSPMVQDWSQLNTWALNPVINQGIALDSGALQMRNGASLIMPYEPGMPSDDLARFTAWDWDCEGVGNPRNASRTCGTTGAHFPEPWQCAGKVDLGADELGELIVAGYLDSTRTFSRPHVTVAANTGGLAFGFYLYYLNVACSPSDLTFIAPQFNLRTDLTAFTPVGAFGRPEWYAQLGPWHNPFTVLPAMPVAFTEGKHMAGTGPVTKRAALTGTHLPGPYPPGASPFSPFMRSRVCDIGARLEEDIFADPLPNNRRVDYAEYPFALWPGAPTGLVEDVFQSNPWYSARPGDIAPNVNDNGFLYGDRSPGTLKHLRSGTTNPPLVVFNDPIQSFFPKSYLFRNGAHPIGYWEPFPFTYTVASYGIAASQIAPVPYITSMEWYGVRVNMELYDPDSAGWNLFGNPVNNVQTFLIVNGPGPGDQARSSNQQTLLSTQGERERVHAEIQRRMVELSTRRR